MGIRKPVAWLSLVVVLAITALTGCGATSRLSAIPASASDLSAQDEGQATAQPTPESDGSSPISLDAIASLEGALERIYEEVSPSVVYIEVRQSQPSALSLPNSPFSQPQVPGDGNPYQTGSGSGFVWDRDGNIVTNNHVVEGADKITVTFSDGTVAQASLVGANPDSDLAVIHVDVSASELVPVTVGNSKDVKVGEVAVAIGNPFGLESTMTVGFISGLGRSLPVESSDITGPTYSIPDVIQTDAPINPGNSGGVLTNDQGEVVGVTAAIASPVRASAGIGFVIPSAIVAKVVPALIESGHYAVPWLGISGMTLNPELAGAMGLDANQRGALVADVADGSPAADAGLVGSTETTTVDGQDMRIGGDVIVAIGGQEIRNFDDLVAFLFSSTEVGQRVAMTVLRDGVTTQVEVILLERPTQQAPQQEVIRDQTDQTPWLGIRGMTLTPEIAQAMEMSSDQAGVLVGDVAQGSPAEKAGLRGSEQVVTIDGQELRVGGDVIVGWDDVTVTEMEQLIALVAGGQAGEEISLTLLRGDAETTVQVTLAARPTN